MKFTIENATVLVDLLRENGIEFQSNIGAAEFKIIRKCVNAAAKPKNKQLAVTNESITSPQTLINAVPLRTIERWVGLYGDKDFLQREAIKAFGYYSDNPRKKPKSVRGWCNALSSWFERAWAWRARQTSGKNYYERQDELQNDFWDKFLKDE